MAPSRPSSPASTLARPVSRARRETFSPPPLSPPHRLSGTSTPDPTPPASYPDTAASSALALTAHVPGLGGVHALPRVLLAHCAAPAETEPAPLPSAMLLGEVRKPWLHARDARRRVSYWITIVSPPARSVPFPCGSARPPRIITSPHPAQCTALLGVLASAAVCYQGYTDTPVLAQPLCLVLHGAHPAPPRRPHSRRADDFSDFSVDADGATWSREIDMGGFGCVPRRAPARAHPSPQQRPVRDDHRRAQQLLRARRPPPHRPDPHRPRPPRRERQRLRRVHVQHLRLHERREPPRCAPPSPPTPALTFPQAPRAARCPTPPPAPSSTPS